MADTQTYTVTKLAGPRVAGQAAKAGAELQLTEAQARSEVLAGAIVKGGKDDKSLKDAKDTDPLKGSEKLPDLQARARGLDKAPKDEPAEAAGKTDGEAKPPATPPSKSAADASGSANADNKPAA